MTIIAIIRMFGIKADCSKTCAPYTDVEREYSPSRRLFDARTIVARASFAIETRPPPGGGLLGMPAAAC